MAQPVTIMDRGQPAAPALLKKVADLRSVTNSLRASGKRVGFVPTMGFLHEGHMSLIRRAKSLCDEVLVSIFVNPTQFAEGEDLERYPRDLERDLDKCRKEGVFSVFAPERREMYPPGDTTRVTVAGLTEHLCGASRPNHFQGVTTVVTKLFAAVGPCTAIFGKKDYQQLKVIERLTADLLLPVSIVPAPIVRESDGLAMSSRNAFLNEEQRKRALALVRALSVATQHYLSGERQVAQLLAQARGILSAVRLELDYLTLADVSTLKPLGEQELVRERAVLALAAFVGPTRLIDNVVLGEDPDPLAAASPNVSVPREPP